MRKGQKRKSSLRNMSTSLMAKDSLTFPRKRGSCSLTLQGGTRQWLSTVYHKTLTSLSLNLLIFLIPDGMILLQIS